MIPWLSLFTAVAWVDFAGIVLSNIISLPKSLSTWYARFGVVAAGSDILIIVLGIALAKFLVPTATGLTLAGIAVVIQIIHDVLFYVGVIRGVPKGQNEIIDLFKTYASEGSWRVIAGDSLMVASSVFIMEWMEENLSKDWIAFAGILAVYSILYILYTK